MSEEIPDGFKKTEIGVIPEEWEVVKLGEVIKYIRNGTTKKQNQEGRGFPVTRIETIADGNINPLKIRWVDELSEEEVKKHLMHKGDILISHINSEPHLGKSAIYEGNPPTLIHGMNLLRLETKKEILNPYFLNYLFSYYRAKGVFISLAARAVGQASINQGRIKTLEVSLPLLIEQKKIAYVLSTIQEAKEKTEAVINASKELKKSLMKYLFTYGPVPLNEAENVKLKETEIGLIPEEWEVVKLGNIGEFQYGYTETATFKPVGPKFLRITDISDEGNINWNTVPYCNIEDDAFKKYELHDGDILIARIGATTGKTCIVKNPPPSVFASYLIRFSSKKDNVNPFFIYYFMRSNLYWQQINAIKEGKLKKGVSASLLKNLFIPLPPLHIQQKIASILSIVDEKIEKEENKKKALEELFKSMLHNLMTGKVRVKDLGIEIEGGEKDK